MFDMCTFSLLERMLTTRPRPSFIALSHLSPIRRNPISPCTYRYYSDLSYAKRDLATAAGASGKHVRDVLGTPAGILDLHQALRVTHIEGTRVLTIEMPTKSLTLRAENSDDANVWVGGLRSIISGLWSRGSESETKEGEGETKLSSKTIPAPRSPSKSRRTPRTTSRSRTVNWSTDKKTGEIATGFVSHLANAGFTQATADKLAVLLRDAAFARKLTSENFAACLIDAKVPITESQVESLSAPDFLHHHKGEDTRPRSQRTKRVKRAAMVRLVAGAHVPDFRDSVFNTPLMSGRLMKKGGAFPYYWKERWFQVNSGYFMYFKRPPHGGEDYHPHPEAQTVVGPKGTPTKALLPLRSLDLRVSDTATLGTDANGCEFIIHMARPGDSLRLAAATPEEAAEWVAGLVNLIGMIKLLQCSDNGEHLTSRSLQVVDNEEVFEDELDEKAGGGNGNDAKEQDKVMSDEAARAHARQQFLDEPSLMNLSHLLDDGNRRIGVEQLLLVTRDALAAEAMVSLSPKLQPLLDPSSFESTLALIRQAAGQAAGSEERIPLSGLLVYATPDNAGCQTPRGGGGADGGEEGGRGGETKGVDDGETKGGETEDDRDAADDVMAAVAAVALPDDDDGESGDDAGGDDDAAETKAEVEKVVPAGLPATTTAAALADGFRNKWNRKGSDRSPEEVEKIRRWRENERSSATERQVAAAAAAATAAGTEGKAEGGAAAREADVATKAETPSGANPNKMR
jgi:hypothetical protein